MSGLKLTLRALSAVSAVSVAGSEASSLKETSRKRSVVTEERPGGTSARRQHAIDSLASCGCGGEGLLSDHGMQMHTGEEAACN